MGGRRFELDVVEDNGTTVKIIYSANEIKESCFTCAIRAQESDDFSRLDMDGDAVHDPSTFVGFCQCLGSQ
mgnify:CR=1 FL=1